MAVPENAIPKIEAWITKQLTDDAALTAITGGRVWRDFAPIETPFPYLIFSMRPGSYYVQGVGTCRIQTNAVYLVKMVTEGDPDDTQVGAFTRFDEVIGAQSNAELNGFLFSGRGVKPVSYPEPRPGTPHYYNHAGGEFSIIAYPAP